MMRLGFSTFTCPDWTLEEVIAAAAEHGYQGIEFRCDAKHCHGLEIYTDRIERKAIQKKLGKKDLQICALATNLQLLDEHFFEQAPARLALAQQVGCPLVRIFLGTPMEGVEPGRVMDTALDNLRHVARMAEEDMIHIAVHTHDLLSRSDLAAQLVTQCERENVGVVYDTLHPCRQGETVKTTLRNLAGLIRLVHFHDGSKRADYVEIKPLGQGELPLDDIFSGLAQLDYQGFLVGEWFEQEYGPNPHEALAKYAEEMKVLATTHGVTLMAH